uniref:EF-hand domain-containing protein n=1 Tax=Neobodo designis TaxID=312471 RepID=A0A7S1LMV2_NEODS|mmetsp:Transcript_25111/g.77595  ORF Transcript_25111/g.77595 Transcript_25111/m.77595 type:complete len:202 (+) Transcript_25111:31-636(+)|eukprot:CAMPEP_0174856108 /NCGR_PEP_ID=MMETSP1114-20130205/35091_1 /TAXON_ID=312471 /ORGANISM="Neobodo designis, Strain CCAP 1951/1" /LENGTH=201 /DNA_ID=CAMNT_0016090885 /DNA_START=32 /DNA_END=637 /DNA_ORIENTATION=+
MPPKPAAAGSPKPPPKTAAAAAAAAAKQKSERRRGATHNRLAIELSDAQRDELRQAFDLFDSEGTGRIQATEVKVALRALGFEVKKDELKQLLTEVGTNPNGTMDFNEFLRVILHKVGEKESKEEVIRAFKMFDDADRGCFTLDDLKRISEELGQELTDDELREMMEFAHPRGKARDHGGREQLQISEEDFMRLMKRANVY